MGLGDVWNRTLVYFGIAEDEEWEEELTTTSEELDRDYRRRERANVRRLPRRREPEAWAEPDSASEAESATPPRTTSSRRGRLRGVDSSGSQVRVHLVLPRSFNDAQQIADRFKDSVPVILN